MVEQPSQLHLRRRHNARGRWMTLRDRELLQKYMADRDFSQARLGRYAEVSRQFINQLISGERSTCTIEVGRRIEEALGVLDGTLFVSATSHGTRPSVARKANAA